MRLLERFRRRRADLEARIADATARAREAGQEADKSRARQDSVREHVVEPLRAAAERDCFADLIRESLVNGNGHRS